MVALKFLALAVEVRIFYSQQKNRSKRPVFLISHQRSLTFGDWNNYLSESGNWGITTAGFPQRDSDDSHPYGGSEK